MVLMLHQDKLFLLLFKDMNFKKRYTYLNKQFIFKERAENNV